MSVSLSLVSVALLKVGIAQYFIAAVRVLIASSEKNSSTEAVAIVVDKLMLARGLKFGHIVLTSEFVLLLSLFLHSSH